jgi:hypothetical protein
MFKQTTPVLAAAALFAMSAPALAVTDAAYGSYSAYYIGVYSVENEAQSQVFPPLGYTYTNIETDTTGTSSVAGTGNIGYEISGAQFVTGYALTTGNAEATGGFASSDVGASSSFDFVNKTGGELTVNFVYRLNSNALTADSAIAGYGLATTALASAGVGVTSSGGTSLFSDILSGAADKTNNSVIQKTGQKFGSVTVAAYDFVSFALFADASGTASVSPALQLARQPLNNVSAVPIPGAVVLLLSGLAGLMAMRRKAKQV